MNEILFDATSQCQMILNHLRNGNKLTTLEAVNMFGCLYTPRRIKDLEAKGHIIIRETIKVEKSNGKKARVTEYSYARENFQRKEVKEPQFQF